MLPSCRNKFLVYPLRKKIMFSIRNLFSKCKQIRRKLRIGSYLLKKSLTKKAFLCAEISFRSSRSHVFFKKGVLKNFVIFKEKQMCWSLFLIKLQDVVSIWPKKTTSFCDPYFPNVFSNKFLKHRRSYFKWFGFFSLYLIEEIISVKS